MIRVTRTRTTTGYVGQRRERRVLVSFNVSRLRSSSPGTMLGTDGAKSHPIPKQWGNGREEALRISPRNIISCLQDFKLPLGNTVKTSPLPIATV